MSLKSNTTDFINKAKLIHGDRYDYSKVDYINAKTKVVIICKEHGEFMQTPNSHLGGRGCRRCIKIMFNYNNNINCRRVFKNKATSIHNRKYDYSLVDYKTSFENVKIICPTHGVFLQSPTVHLRGGGCRKCANDGLREKRRHGKDMFITMAINTHGLLYDYSLVDYFNARTKVKIICPKHGLFYQAPHLHLRGERCPMCRSSRGEIFICNILDNYDILYVKEKTFKSCKIEKPMKFDFYLYEYNTLIEYHGEQHFVPAEWMGGLKHLMMINRNDEYKKRWAIENGYIFKEYSYKDSWDYIEKDIKKILQSFLK